MSRGDAYVFYAVSYITEPTINEKNMMVMYYNNIQKIKIRNNFAT